MFSHIIFDLDGTLIESLPGLTTALNSALAEHSLPSHPESTVRTFIGDGSRTLCARALAPNPSEDDINSLHSAFIRLYASSWKSGTSIFAGISDAIAELKKFDCTLSVLSNKPHKFTTEIVNYFFPDHPFDLILGQRDGVAKKPDPSGVHEIMGEFNLSSAKTILVGDSTVDIITARNAGVASLAVTWGYHSRNKLAAVCPRYTVHSPAELLLALTPTSRHAFR